MMEFKQTVDIHNIVALMIDEVSTVSPRCLAALSKRFQQATGNYECPFGGVILILVGNYNYNSGIMSYLDTV